MLDYVDWKAAYQAFIVSADVPKQDALRARLHNLESEERIDLETGMFRDQLVDEFTQRCGVGQSPADASNAALNHVIAATWTAQTLLRKLAAPVSIGRVNTYATALDLAQYGGLGDIEADDPQK